jgi:hypothetical protein
MLPPIGPQLSLNIKQVRLLSITLAVEADPVFDMNAPIIDTDRALPLLCQIALPSNPPQ